MSTIANDGSVAPKILPDPSVNPEFISVIFRGGMLKQDDLRFVERVGNERNTLQFTAWVKGRPSVTFTLTREQAMQWMDTLAEAAFSGIDKEMP